VIPSAAVAARAADSGNGPQLEVKGSSKTWRRWDWRFDYGHTTGTLRASCGLEGDVVKGYGEKKTGPSHAGLWSCSSWELNGRVSLRFEDPHSAQTACRSGLSKNTSRRIGEDGGWLSRNMNPWKADSGRPTGLFGRGAHLADCAVMAPFSAEEQHDCSSAKNWRTPSAERTASPRTASAARPVSACGQNVAVSPASGRVVTVRGTGVRSRPLSKR